MEKVYIKKRNINVITVAYFCLLSLFFLFFIYIFKNEQSLLISSQALIFINSFSWYVFLSLLTLFSVWFYKKIAPALLLIYLIVPVFAGIYVLFLNFDKLLLFSFFFYLIFAYFIFFLFLREIKSAYFRSNYLENDFLSGNLFKIKVEITHQNIVYHAQITNWDRRSLFVIFNDKCPNVIGAECDILISYLGRNFNFLARPLSITRSKRGMGFEINENIQLKARSDKFSELGWEQIYFLLMKRGNIPT